MKRMMSKVKMYSVLIAAVLISGCAVPCEPKIEYKNVYVKQACDTKMPVEPQWSDESITERPLFLKAKMENSGKHKEFEYELKAALNKCIK